MIKEKKNDAFLQRKYSEASMMNVRKKQFRNKDSYYYYEEYFNDVQDKKENKEFTEIDNTNNNNLLQSNKFQFNSSINTNTNTNNNTIKNHTNYNMNGNNNFTSKNHKVSNFPKLAKTKKLKISEKDKEKYQKKFKDNYSKLRNFLNHLFFMRKKLNIQNNIPPNLSLGNTKANSLSNSRSSFFKVQIKELMKKFKNKKGNDLDNSNAVNLYIVNICSPAKHFQKDMLSLSRSVFSSKVNIYKKKK
jgi:hypothetical protein